MIHYIAKTKPAVLKQSTEGFTCDRTITNDAVLFDADSQKFIAHYIPNCLKNHDQFFTALQNEKIPRSDRTSGISCQSLIFGFAPNDPLKNLPARPVKQSQSTVKIWKQMLDQANDLFKLKQPELFQNQVNINSKTLKPAWILPGGAFTSGIINKSNQLVFHTDNGNTKDCLSNMFCVKRGIAGGRLFLPEYDLAIEIGNASLLIFDGQSVSHGVEHFKKMSPQSERYTIVFYSLEKLKHAQSSPELEIKKFNNDQNRKLK